MGGIKKVRGTEGTGGTAGTPASADPADVHAMRAAMNEEPEQPALSSLFSAQGAAAEEAEKARTVNPDEGGRGGDGADDDAESLAEDVAARVLVTDSEYSDDEEVRIYLKDSVLRDTEVHLRRMPDALEVRVQTGDRGSYGILLGAKDALGQRLEKSSELPVHLDIVLVGAE